MKNLNNIIVENILKNKTNECLINGNIKERKFTYKEFLDSTLVFYEYFRNSNLKKGNIVLIPGIKKKETYCIIFACLFYGITYCVYDPKSPKERLTKIINLLKPNFFIQIKGGIKIDLNNRNTDSIQIEDFDFFIEKKTNIEKNMSKFIKEIKTINDSETNAYIMFTSGSTGIPKGSIITRINLFNFVFWIKNTFNQKRKNKIISNINPLYFDNSIFDIFSTIPFGHSLKFYDTDNKNTLKILEEDLYNQNLDQWFSVPSLLIKLQKISKNRRFSKQFNLENYKDKKIIFGGEGYAANLLKEMMEKFNSYTFINVYGPTECTCIATTNFISSSSFSTYKCLPSLGNVINNFTFEIINKDEFGIGELLLKGNFVGEGYIHNLLETKKRFSFKEKYNSYLTGDLVKEIKGELYHCGRTDYQIKRMGYRIELEEIEYIVSSLNNVLDSAAIFIKDSERSFLYIILQLDKLVEKKSLIRDIKRSLPNYMYPDDILVSDNISRNRNGKVDRRLISNQISNYKSLIFQI